MCWCTARPENFRSTAYVIHLGPDRHTAEDVTNACVWSNTPQWHWVSPVHMDHSYFGLAVLVQTTRSILDLFKCVHLCTNQRYEAYWTGIMYSFWTVQVHKCTHFPGIFEVLLWLECDILEILDRCLKSFSMPRQSSPVKNLHICGTPDVLSLSTRRCYCFRYILVEKCAFPSALQYKPRTCMHESKQAEDGSAAVCRFFSSYNAK